MKHVEQSLRTKQELSDALKKLMETKLLSHITIRELVESCGLNRKTFYYHFEDIYALLKWTLEQEAVSCFEQFDLVKDSSAAVEFVLDYISKNIAMLRNIVHSIGRSELSRFFFKDICSSVRKLVCEVERMMGLKVDEDYKTFLSKFLTEAIAGVLLDCIEHDTLDEREKLTHHITATLTATIPNALRQLTVES